MLEIVGSKEIDRTLRTLPDKIRISAMRATARKAAKPVIKAVRDEIASSIDFSQEGQSKAAYISRNVKAITLRSKDNPGVYVGVKGKDIQVGKRSWDVRAYAILLGEGSYHGIRQTRGTKQNRGKFKGFGNFIERGSKNAGNAPLEIMLNEIDKEINNALNRAING